MRRYPSIGQFNVALIALYVIPVWGRDAARVFISSVYGLDDRAHLVASAFYMRLFNLHGLPQVATVLAGLKLIMATVFLAYVIDVLRGVAIGRQEDQATLGAALVAAIAGILVFALPFYLGGHGDLVRLQATQFLMVMGAVIVCLTERSADGYELYRPGRMSLTLVVPASVPSLCQSSRLPAPPWSARGTTCRWPQVPW